ncbi:MAG: hypothetical protein Kow0074_02690 [Candidatus Zixiibacteriota bacterium]
MKQAHTPAASQSDRQTIDPKCVDLLRETLNEHRGLTGASWNRQKNQIQLAYSAEKISDEAVRRIGEELNRRFSHRYRACRFDPKRGTCDGCSRAALNGATETEYSIDFDDNHIVVESPNAPQLVKAYKQDIDTIPPPPPQPQWQSWLKQHHLVIWTSLAGVLILSGWIVESTGRETAGHILYLLGYISGGWLAAKESFDGLREYRFDVNLLMTLAAIGAAILGRWAEGATLIFLFSLSNTLEHYALERTKNAVRALMNVRPSEARVIRGGVSVKVAVEDLQIDDLVIVKPSEKIPADGVITEGRTTVDNSTFTGESVPIERGPSDEVLTGTINQSGQITVRVTRRAADTALAAVIHRVEQAQSGRTPTHSFVRWFGQRYTIGILAGATLVAVVPPLAFGLDWSAMFYKALTLLVVSSPCALIISTPAAVLSAIGRAARRGVLFKSGASLIDLGNVRAIAFDKTGTLTQGRAILTDVVPLNGAGEHDLLAMAAAVETGSTHPFAEAIINAARQRSIDYEAAADATTHPGRGATGVLPDQRRVIVGNRGLFQIERITIDELAEQTMQSFEAQGKTAVLVGVDRVLGVLAITDPPRDAAAKAVADIRAQGIESVSMLTGDHQRVANTIAERLGIDTVTAELLPEQKADAVEDLMRRHKSVATVGDGINDAPALASSTVGIAMGGAGTDVVLETADVVLMADDLSRLPFAIQLAKRTNRIIKQNLTFALTVIVLLLIGTFLGKIRLPIGVVGHEGSTLLVVLNSLRLLWHK